MRICGYGISDVSCNSISLGAKDVAIALVALAALGIIVTGALQLGGIVSIGALASIGSIFVGIGSSVLAIDVLVAIVKNCLKKTEEAVDSYEFQKDPEVPAKEEVEGSYEFLKDPEVLTSAFEVRQAYEQLKEAFANGAEVNDLIEKSTELTSKLARLDRSEKKANKQLIDDILKQQIAIKAKYKKEDPNLHQALKKLERAALIYYFAKKLESQLYQVIQLEKNLKSYLNKDPHFQFLQNTIDRWKKKLNDGKPVSFPKWFHCTTSAYVLNLIVHSKIFVRKESCFRGAFVSSKMEVGFYGHFGIAMSHRIEKTATKKHTIPPICTKAKVDDVVFLPKEEPQENVTPRINKREDVLYWIGFQENIPIKRVDKTQNPLLFYTDVTISFLFYDHVFDASEIRDLKELAKKVKVPTASVEQLEALRNLFGMTFLFTAPEIWKNLSW